MFRCHICGSTEAQDQFIDEVFNIDGKLVLVEHIPAKVCSRCGEAVFSREATEKIRRMVHSEAQSLKSIELDVFAFA